jgi:hypothetical protein
MSDRLGRQEMRQSRSIWLAQARTSALVIPEEPSLAHGTADPLADARTQAEFGARGVRMPEAEGGWDTVDGRLEGFRPGNRGSYCRSLVTAHSAKGPASAWAYHKGFAQRGREILGGHW